MVQRHYNVNKKRKEFRVPDIIIICEYDSEQKKKRKLNAYFTNVNFK